MSTRIGEPLSTRGRVPSTGEPTQADGAAQPSRRLREIALALGWVGVIAPYVFELGAIARANHTALISRLPDDAFYYLEIAARLARGQGFTFDGIHETNGFHPLWQLMLTPFAAFLHGDALIRGALVVGLLCSFAAVLLVMRLVWRLGGAGPALLGAIVASQFVLRSWVNGMEGPVVILGVSLVLTTLVAAAEDPAPRQFMILGLSCSVLVLARLDFTLVVLVVPLALMWRTRSWRSGGSCPLEWCNS